MYYIRTFSPVVQTHLWFLKHCRVGCWCESLVQTHCSRTFQVLNYKTPGSSLELSWLQCGLVSLYLFIPQPWNAFHSISKNVLLVKQWDGDSVLQKGKKEWLAAVAVVKGLTVDVVVVIAQAGLKGQLYFDKMDQGVVNRSRVYRRELNSNLYTGDVKTVGHISLLFYCFYPAVSSGQF